MIGAEIKVSRSSLNGVLAQMERARKSLGMTLGASVKFGMRSAAVSLSAATAVSPKKRKSHIEVTEKPRILKSGKVGKRPIRTKRYGVIYHPNRHSEPKFLPVPGAKSKSDANKSKQAKINRSGLAKASWRQAASQAGIRGIRGSKADGQTKSRAWKLTSGTGKYVGKEPYAIISNRVSYIEEAMRGGRSAIDVALKAAGRSMEKEITRRMNEMVKAF